LNDTSEKACIEIINKLDFLYKRNTKDSIGDEKYNFTINTSEIKLEFTEQERNIYNSYLAGSGKKTTSFLIKMCCDLNNATDIIKNCKTFDEIQKVLLENNYNIMEKSLSVQETLKFKIKLKEDSLKNINDECDWVSHVKTELGNDRRQLTNECNNYNCIKRIYDYLKKTIDNIKKKSENICPICLDDIWATECESDVAITKCGHLFCYDCINEYISDCKIIKCPTCNTDITKNDIHTYKDETNVQIKLDDNCSRLVNKLKSTKLGNIVYYLQNKLQVGDKVIVFSQWDTILEKIGNELNHLNNYVYCKGTVYNRKKSIKRFCESTDTNILLLSNKNTASGLNLVAANKIIFVEPIYGTLEYKQSIYAQSIGRCARIGQTREIEVVKFIIKDTVEESIETDDEETIDTKLF
jgi:SNF2 family DNA or RNA helicase